MTRRLTDEEYVQRARRLAEINDAILEARAELKTISAQVRARITTLEDERAQITVEVRTGEVGERQGGMDI